MTIMVIFIMMYLYDKSAQPNSFFPKTVFLFLTAAANANAVATIQTSTAVRPTTTVTGLAAEPRVQLHPHLCMAILTQPPLLFSHDVRLLRTNSPMQSTMVWTIAGWPWRTQSTARAPATAYRETTFPQVTPSGEVERDTEHSHQWKRAQYGKVLRSRSRFDLVQREVMSLQSENFKFPLLFFKNIYLFIF